MSNIRLFSILSLVAIFSGCAERADSPETEEQVPLLFCYNSTAYRPQTKASIPLFVDGIEKQTIPLGKDVGMYGYYQGTTTWNDWTASKTAEGYIFNNKQMESEGPDDDVKKANLVYTNLRYWPNMPNAKCAFIAYYPYNGTGITANSGGSYHFVSEDNSEDQVDFMVSEFKPNLTKPSLSNPTVSLKFNHMLAQVIVNPNKYNIANIAKIKFTGIAKSGDCSVTYGSDETSYTWSNIVKYASGDGPEITNFSSNNRILLCIPHVTSGAKIQVYLKSGTVDEYDIDNIPWNMAGVYTYNIGDGLGRHDIPIIGTELFRQTSTDVISGDTYYFDRSKLPTISEETINSGKAVIAVYYETSSVGDQWGFHFHLRSCSNGEEIFELRSDGCSDGGYAYHSSSYEPRQAYYFRLTPEMWSMLTAASNTYNHPADKCAYVMSSEYRNINVEAITIITDPDEVASVEQYIYSGD